MQPPGTALNTSRRPRSCKDRATDDELQVARRAWKHSAGGCIQQIKKVLHQSTYFNADQSDLCKLHYISAITLLQNALHVGDDNVVDRDEPARQPNSQLLLNVKEI